MGTGFEVIGGFPRAVFLVPGVVPAAGGADVDEVLFGVGFDFVVKVLEIFFGAGGGGVIGVLLEEAFEGDEVAVVEDAFADAFEEDGGVEGGPVAAGGGGEVAEFTAVVVEGVVGVAEGVAPDLEEGAAGVHAPEERSGAEAVDVGFFLVGGDGLDVSADEAGEGGVFGFGEGFFIHGIEVLEEGAFGGIGKREEADVFDVAAGGFITGLVVDGVDAVAFHEGELGGDAAGRFSPSSFLMRFVSASGALVEVK